jgi:biopolymer transport protein ExbB/biopolymer transport protein TolQ
MLGFDLSSLGLPQMSAIGWAVILILLLLSIGSLVISAERLIVFRRARRQSRAYAGLLTRELSGARPQALLEASNRYPHSHVARVISAGLWAFQQKSARRLSSGEVIEATARALDRSIQRTTAELRRGIGSLATIASTAPFIGLFGTVIGIVHAFGDIAENQGAGFEIVSQGISEALWATALGLLVAIPAAWMFNVLTQKIDLMHLEMESSASELTDFLIERDVAAAVG